MEKVIEFSTDLAADPTVGYVSLLTLGRCCHSATLIAYATFFSSPVFSYRL
jgi:hypothetical protein